MYIPESLVGVSREVAIDMKQQLIEDMRSVRDKMTRARLNKLDTPTYSAVLTMELRGSQAQLARVERHLHVIRQENRLKTSEARHNGEHVRRIHAFKRIAKAKLTTEQFTEIATRAGEMVEAGQDPACPQCGEGALCD